MKISDYFLRARTYAVRSQRIKAKMLTLNFKSLYFSEVVVFLVMHPTSSRTIAASTLNRHSRIQK